MGSPMSALNPLPPGYVTVATEAVESRKGTPFNNTQGPREYTLVFRVIVTSIDFASPNLVCQCPGIPAPYSAYITPDGTEFDPNAFLIKLEPRKQDPTDYQVWLVECTYSTEVPTGGIPQFVSLGINPRGAQQDPTQWLPTFKWDKETVTVAYQTDMNNKPFLNSSGQPFTPAPVFEASRAVLIMNRFETNLSRATITNYSYAVNSDTFLGAAPGTVRLDPITADQAILGGVQYWKTTYRFVFNRVKFNAALNQVIGPPLSAVTGQPALQASDPLESWQPAILDAGTMRLVVGPVPNFGQPVPIISNHGAIPITQPVPLNGAGQPALFLNSAGNVALPSDGGVLQAVYLNFTIYRARPFAPLIQGVNTAFVQ